VALVAVFELEEDPVVVGVEEFEVDFADELETNCKFLLFILFLNSV
jgi:hypothetical protein